MIARLRVQPRGLAPALLVLSALTACSSGTEPKCTVSTVSVAPNTVSVLVGQSTTLSATVNSSNCATAPTVIWGSGGAGVAVSSAGLSAQVTGVVVSGTPVAVTATALSVSGASQVTVTGPPSIDAAPTSLSFFAAPGGANPASQAISITNSGGGTLAGLSTGTVVYSVGATGWLQTPSLSSAAAPATLTVQPMTGALAAGVYTATIPLLAAAASNSPQSITVTFTVAAPGLAVVAFAGANQTGLVGFALNVAPAVRVTNGGVPVANSAVTFAVQSGGGSILGSTTINTNANGVAQLLGWALGSTPMTNTLTATATGAGVAGNPVTFSATGAAATFDITIQNIGPAFSAEVQTAFTLAVSKWQQVIYQDIPAETNFTAGAGTCGSNSPAIGPVTVDDVVIFARIDSIDGPGGILGQAGPCWIRDVSFLTVLGTMMFDSADVAGLVAGGTLDAVILHEMGHVLGFGTLWDPTLFNCLRNASTPPGSILDTYFNCPKGRAMFDSIGGTTYTGGNKVPVENCGPTSPANCGGGNVNGHWREPTFRSELMTGYLNPGSNPFSKLTAAAMEDLGYGVNYAGADNYVQPFTLRTDGAGGNDISLGADIYRGPIIVVDRSGRIVTTVRPR